MPILPLDELNHRHQAVIDENDDIYNPQSPINVKQAYINHLLRQIDTLTNELHNTEQQRQDAERAAFTIFMLFVIAAACGVAVFVSGVANHA